VLAGGGIDSNLILAVLFEQKAKDVNVWTYKYESNYLEVENLSKFCRHLSYKHHIFTEENLNLERYVCDFENKFNRKPNDVAAPIVSALAEKAKEHNACKWIVDGQYADTYLFANPQNKYFWLTKYLSVLNFLNFYSWIQSKGNNFLIKLIFVFASIEIKILFLSRIKINKESFTLISNIRSRTKLNDMLLFQVIFKTILLNEREADKYKLVDCIASPFKSEKLFRKYAKRINTKKFHYPNKKSVYSLMSKMQPEYILGSKSRSFKL